MPSEFNHIDEFFRRKEAEAEAPAHLQDQHWQQVKDQLASPGSPAPTPKSSLFKFVSIVGGSVMALLTAWLVYSTSKNGEQTNKEKQQSSVQQKQPALQQDTLPTLVSRPDSFQFTASAVRLKDTPVTFVMSAKLVNHSIKKDTFLFVNTKVQKPDTVVVQFKPVQPKQERIKLEVDTINLKGNKLKIIDQKSKVTESEQKVAFETFFKPLEKAEQVFEINTSRDTTLYGTEGTVLHIPANSFVSGEGEIKRTVTVSLREFYKIEDIVGNKLSTMSNGQPLVSGGMLHITAQADGETLRLKNGASLDLNMPVSKFDPQMQLFTGTTRETIQKDSERDSGSNNNDHGTINWIPQGQVQRFYASRKKMIRVWNMRDNPNVVRYKHEYNPSKSKTVGVFRIPWNSAYSTEEIKTELVKRFGKYYDEIKVRRDWKPLYVKNRKSDTSSLWTWYETPFVGDSVEMHISTATRLKYITHEDSLRYEARWKQELEALSRRNESYKALTEIKDKYNFKISALGWINCDRFLAYPPAQLTDFNIALQNEFHDQYFHSVLLFKNQNVLMQGWMEKGTIRFSRIPLGEEVVLICIGVKEGKAYSTVQKLKVHRETEKDIRFEAMTPEVFREKLKQFGSVLNRG